MANLTTAPFGSIRQTPTFNPSPKTRFRESGDSISKHRALLESGEFQRALDYALLEYQLQAAAQVRDTNAALAFGYKMIGVQEFISTLKLLSEVPRMPTPAVTENLDHKV